jgi:caspase domain-containing protein
MGRRALLVGINHYDYMPKLTWCTDDALAMHQVLLFHENHEPNFDCRVLLGSEPIPGVPRQERVTFNRLRKELQELFAFDDMVLFYFSGHGYATANGVYLVSQDGTGTLPGILLNDLLKMANLSPAREVLLIIDSCYSGALGEPDQNKDIANLYLRPGITLMTAARANQKALEMNGRGLFTHLIIGALKGGASDIRGHVSAASIYAYVEQALGPWDQRPIYKSNAVQLSSIRLCTPDITDDDLRCLPEFFPQPDYQYFLDPSYERVQPEALPAHVAIFQLFKRYQVARLLRPLFDKDLYFAAMQSHPVELTPIGQFYWQLAKQHVFGRVPLLHASARLSPVPDAESVAKLFHETYERLAPTFGYETRVDTRVTWEQVPEQNKRLMIATITEVLTILFPPEATTSAANNTSEEGKPPAQE